MKTILVVGGAGYIGSMVNKRLHQAGYRTVVLDNLSTGSKNCVLYGTFVEGDMGDAKLLDQIFSSHQIDAVMHFAALINVGESVAHPAKYYANNVCKTLALLEAMLRHQIRTFLFSSSAAIFGIPQTPKITEEHPCYPINPYGESKLMVERILKDFDRAYGLRFSCLRYFNAAGGDPEGEIRCVHTQESNLIPRLLKNLLKGDNRISVFGTDYPTPDGTCIRDYIHIADLADAHLAALKQLLAGGASTYYNLGNGQGFSVREVIAAAAEVTQRPIASIDAARREGDPPILVADASKARRELGWQPQRPSLQAMIADAWKMMQ